LHHTHGETDMTALETINPCCPDESIQVHGDTGALTCNGCGSEIDRADLESRLARWEKAIPAVRAWLTWIDARPSTDLPE